MDGSVTNVVEHFPYRDIQKNHRKQQPFDSPLAIKMRLQHKVALVTGAGSGIGRATAELFAKEGASVLASDINETPVAELVDAIRAEGGKAETVTGDVSNSTDAKTIVDTASELFGGLDIVINSAGVSARNALGSSATPEEIWDRVIEVNLKGTYLISWYAAEGMVKDGNGSIINLASIMGIVGYPQWMNQPFNPYPPSKGGVVQLTKNMAVALAKDGVRVNCICPGFVWSNLTELLTSDSETLRKLEELHPMKRLGQPEEIANVALYLASDESSYVTGSSLVVDGGYTAR